MKKLSLVSLVILSMLPFSAHAFASAPEYDAVVDARFEGMAGAKINGTPYFNTLNAALEAAPADSAAAHVIFIRAGRYHEKIVVAKPNITLVGENRDSTILTFNDYSGIKDAKGNSIGTWRCATLIVRATDFKAENLTVENAFDYLGNDAKNSADPTRTSEPQAVALMTDRGADRTFLQNVRLMGYQDTLFTSVGRTFIDKSIIAGNIDFIFGAGQTVINHSEIVTRPRGRNMRGEPVGYITAPSTPLADPYGLVIMNSRLVKESDRVPARSCPLGRPWHPTTTFPDGRYADPNAVGAAVFIHCWMDEHITEAGWDKMQGTSRKAGEKDWFYPDNPNHARFAEYESSGPGAQINADRKQLSVEEAQNYTIEKLLHGWNPQ
ncbi:MAG: pectinesterase family protein [Formivibrio sp.]|nr:pectinesterase family protein [Formivibrio sp.]